jgi:hypothetical protein
MNYKNKFLKYKLKYLDLKTGGSYNKNEFSLELTKIFINIYFKNKTFNETIKEYEILLQEYINLLKIPIKYVNRTIFIINKNSEVFCEIKIPDAYFQKDNFFQENIKCGEPYIINFLNLGLNIYYDNYKSEKLKEVDMLIKITSGIMFNMGKYKVNKLDGNSILNKNTKDFKTYSIKLVRDLELLEEIKDLIVQNIENMNNTFITNSSFGRYHLVRMIEEQKNEENLEICNKIWKLVTSDIYNYEISFLNKENIFKSRMNKSREEIIQLVYDNIENYEIDYNKIVNFCKDIKDMTNVNLSNNLRENIFKYSLKPNTPCNQLPDGSCGPTGIWNTQDGLIQGNKNSPEKVTYFANLFTKYLETFFPNKIRPFVVGGLFPSYFINQMIKDYDFVLLSNLKDFRNLMLPIIFLFVQFCEVSQGLNLLPDGDIAIKDESQKNDLNKPRNFNIKVDVPNFEGLDIVLPRNLIYDKNNQSIEEDIDLNFIKDLDNDEELKEVLLVDLRRRECYLNALYAEMKYDQETNLSSLNIFDYLPKKRKAKNLDERKLINNFNNSFKKWQEIPTDGLETFISDYFRIIRIFKMNLKKSFDCRPSIDLINKNLIKVLEYYNQQNRDIIFHKSNGIVAMFKLLKSNVKTTTSNPKINLNLFSNQKVIEKNIRINIFGEYLYKLSFIFYIINSNLQYEIENELNISEVYENKIKNIEYVFNHNRKKVKDLKEITYSPSIIKYLKQEKEEVNMNDIEKYLTFIERTRLYNENEKKRNKFFYVNSSVSLEVFLRRFNKIFERYLLENNDDEMLLLILYSYLLPSVNLYEMETNLYKNKIKDTFKSVETIKKQFNKNNKKYKLTNYFNFRNISGIIDIHIFLDEL